MKFDREIVEEYWRKATKQWQSKLEKVCRFYGATYVDRLIIDVLSKHESINKKVIAAELCTESQNLTRSLTRLVAANLITCINLEKDNRYRVYSLTEKGYELAHKISKANNNIWDTALSGIDNNDLIGFQNCFIAMSKNIDKSIKKKS